MPIQIRCNAFFKTRVELPLFHKLQLTFN
uniref:Uncharacterized protein n=1 Tax=Arundo donax TaxID=35708 RepID=A0A0A8Z6W5_ARUDO